MIYDTPVTEIYDTRYPSPSVIRGTIALRSPSGFDLSTLAPGHVLTEENFDLPKLSTVGNSGNPGTFVISSIIYASSTRVYVLLASDGYGWWRIDTTRPTEPERTEIRGELTPIPGAQALLTIATDDLRVDDLLYASGLPAWEEQAPTPGPVCTRVLDLITAPDDGRGPAVLIRTAHGWFVWRQRFVQVANL
jgi:hypothetical protein